MKFKLILITMLIFLFSLISVNATDFTVGNKYWWDFIGAEDLATARIDVSPNALAFDKGLVGFNDEGITCDGSTQFLNTTDLVGITGGDAETLVFWIKIDTSVGNDIYIQHGDEFREYRTLHNAGGNQVDFWGYNPQTVGSVGVNIGGWSHYALKVNRSGNGGALYQDGVKINFIDPLSPSYNTVDSPLSVCNGYFGVFADMDVSSIGLYDIALTDNEILELSNLPRNFTPYDVAVSELNILFSNSTSPLTSKTVFNEGEEFYIFLNWTESNIPLNDSVGSCNITLLNGIFENESQFKNFQLCDVGCDFDKLNETFTMDGANDTQPVKEDVLRIKLCHSNNANRDFNVNISCGLNSNEFIINKLEFPLCSVGNSTVLRTFTTCNGFDNINITLGDTVPFNSRHTVGYWELDREYPEHLITGEDMLFNDTFGLWFTKHAHEYYEHGTKIIYGNCTHETESDLDNNVIGGLTIVNQPPIVFVSQIRYNDSTFTNFNQTGLSFFEFRIGIHELIYTVIDDDLANFTLSNYNSQGKLLFNVTLFNVTAQPINGTTFFNFTDSNPYNLTLFAIDTVGNWSFVSYLYNVTDTIDPVISGTENETVIQNDTFVFNIHAFDEYLWSFNIVCDNGINFSKSEIANQSFTYAGTILSLNESMSCVGNVSDGHTDRIMRDIDIVNPIEDKSKLEFDGLILDAREDIKRVTYVKNVDRYNFCYETVSKEDELSIDIPSGCVRAPNSPYKGHYVCEQQRLAIDFEGDNPVKYSDENLIVIDTSKSSTNNICFNSIIELNTVQFTKFVEVTIPETPQGSLLTFCFDFNNMSHVLFLFALAMFYLGLVTISLFFRNFAFGLFAFCIGFVIAIMLTCFSHWLMISIILVNVIYFLSLIGLFKG